MDFGSLIGGAAAQMVMSERTRDVNARSAADQRQTDEREAEKSRAFSSHEAQVTRDWTRDMSSTAHQREIRDLQLAGLNPILSGTGGMGSASPAGAQASSAKAAASLGNPTDYGRVVGSALDAKRNKQEVELLTQQTYNTMMDTAKKDKERTYYHMLGQKTDHERETAAEETKIRRHDEKGRRLEGEIDESRYGEIMRYIDRLRNSISPLKLGPTR